MKILLGMSGGIDSSYAAKKLLDEGHEVVGAILVMHEYTDTSNAVSAAEKLGIECVVIDCKSEFDSVVREYFVNEYSRARTPNPCIVCNPGIKFRFLYEYAVSNGFDKIATGHYANIRERVADNGERRYYVSAARDAKKDQTYMLYRLPQEILAKLYLPLGNELKENIKERAVSLGIVNKAMKESQEICFIPDNDYRGYIENERGVFPMGNFVDESGAILGKHDGIIGYTVGQRKGLGISLGSRVFVSKIDPVTNEITLSTARSSCTSVTISDIVFSGQPEPEVNTTIDGLTVKLRYSAGAAPASFTYLGEGRGRVEIAEPVNASAPGQSAVLYGDFGVVLGGFID